MDAKAATERMTARAQRIIGQDEQHRKRLADALMETPATQLDHLMEEALEASAIANPWRQLLLRIERVGVREALAKQRAEATDALLSFGFALSTSQVANANRHHQLFGMRRFLSATETVEIDDDEPTPEPAEEAAQEPSPAPAEKPVKVTPAQKRTLQSIKEAGVTLNESRIGGGVRVETKPGHARPRRDMVEYVIELGWALRDNATSLYTGQAVTLSPAGEAILAR